MKKNRLHTFNSREEIIIIIIIIIKKSTTGNKIIGYWVEHTSLPSKVIEAVDCEATRKSHKDHKCNKKQWASKVAAKVLPTGMIMADRELWETEQ